MITSAAGIAFLRKAEGVRATMYLDSAGLPTIGVGHLLTKSELSSGRLDLGAIPWKERPLTDEEIDALLHHDLAGAETAVTNAVHVGLTQNEFDCLVSFTFNIGVRAFQDSTLLTLLNHSQYQEVPGQLRRWVHSAGKVDPGLVARREREVRLWMGEP